MVSVNGLMRFNTGIWVMRLAGLYTALARGLSAHVLKTAREHRDAVFFFLYK